MASDNTVAGKWTCKESHIDIHITCEFFADGTYTYYNHTTGHSNKARYSLSGSVATADNGWKFTLRGDTLELDQGPGLTFRRV